MPMPGPGQAPAPQGQPEAGGAPQDKMSQLVSGVGQGLTIISQMLGKAEGAPPEAKELSSQLLSGFEQLVSMMTGGGAQGQPQAATASPEAGGARGAVPQNPAMR